jgi:hypothetical protein
MSDTGDEFGGDEARTQLVTDLGVRAREIGLYLEGAEFAKAIRGLGQGMDGRTVLVAAFAIGDRAFATDVMYPITDAFNEAFRGIKIDAEDEENAEQARALQELRDSLDEDG